MSSGIQSYDQTDSSSAPGNPTTSFPIGKQLPNSCLNCLQPTSPESSLDKSSIQIDGDDFSLPISQVLNTIFNIQIPDNQNLNLHLCSNCSSIISQAYKCHSQLLNIRHINSWLNSVLIKSVQKSSTNTNVAKLEPREEEVAPVAPIAQIEPQTPNLNIVNLIPLQVIPSSINGTLVAPIKNKKIKQALISTNPGTESILILESNEISQNPPKRRLLVPTEFYDLSRAHSCTICGESFLQKSSLEFHIHWIHNGKTKYLCNLCLQPLGSEAVLQQHMKLQHPEVIDVNEHFKIVENCKNQSMSNKRSNRKSSTPMKICEKEFEFEDNIISSKTREFVCSICSKIFPTVNLRNAHERDCNASLIHDQPLNYVKKPRLSTPFIQKSTIDTISELQCPYSTNCLILVPNGPAANLTTKRKLLLKHIKTVHPEQKVRLEVLDDFILRSGNIQSGAEVQVQSGSAKRTNHRTTSAASFKEFNNTPMIRVGRASSSSGAANALSSGAAQSSSAAACAPSAAAQSSSAAACALSSGAANAPSAASLLSSAAANAPSGASLSSSVAAGALSSAPPPAITTLPIPTFSGPCTCGTPLSHLSRSKIEDHFKTTHNKPIKFQCPFCDLFLGTNGKNSFRKHLIFHYSEEGRSSGEDRVLRTECGLVLERDNL